MSNFEVNEPILNSPFAEPQLHWFIQSGKHPEQRDGRRAAIVFPPRNQSAPSCVDDFKQIAVRVIDDRGNEMLAVKKREGVK